jgi:hypothetical protein
MLRPALAKARLEARKAACASNLHNFGLQYAMYHNDWSGRWPGAEEGQVTRQEALASLYPLYSDNLLQFSCPGSPTTPFLDVNTGLEGSAYGVDLYIPNTADPARVVMADGSMRNHGGGGAEALFADSHVQWCRKTTNSLGDAIVPNPQLAVGPYDMTDTDIYMLQHGARDPLADTTLYEHDAEIEST